MVLKAIGYNRKSSVNTLATGTAVSLRLRSKHRVGAGAGISNQILRAMNLQTFYDLPLRLEEGGVIDYERMFDDCCTEAFKQMRWDVLCGRPGIELPPRPPESSR